MWFLEKIIEWLDSIAGYFYSAYETVADWIFPFNLLATILYYIYYAFATLARYFVAFNDWADEIARKLAEQLNIETILSYLRTFIDYATLAWEWVQNAASYISSRLNEFWISIRPLILAWIENIRQALQAQINELATFYEQIRQNIAEILKQLPPLSELWAWFKDWWAHVLHPLTSWWHEKLKEIQSLVFSWLKEMFPFYNELVELWNEIKKFFADPLQWLYDKMDEFFERFW